MNGTLNDVLGVIGRYGGDRSRLSDIQVQSLQSLIDGVSFKVAKKATRRSTVDDLTGEILRVMNINGVRDPSTLKVIVSKVVEWELDSTKENFRTFFREQHLLSSRRNECIGLVGYVARTKGGGKCENEEV